MVSVRIDEANEKDDANALRTTLTLQRKYGLQNLRKKIRSREGYYGNNQFYHLINVIALKTNLGFQSRKENYF